MRRFTILFAALAVVAAACSSSPASSDTTTTSGGGGQEPTTTAQDSGAPATTTTTSMAETTTTSGAGAGALESCVVGRWVLDPAAFFDQIMASEEEIDGEFAFLGGEYVLNIEEDGTFTSTRDNWMFAVTSDFGDLQVTVNESDVGTWTFNGNVLTTTLQPGDPAEIEILVDGQPLVLPGGVAPFEPPEVEFTGAAVSCDNDTLTATFDGNDSVWTRT